MFLCYFSAAKALIDDYEPSNLSDPEKHRVVQGLGTPTKSKLTSEFERMRREKRDEILRPQSFVELRDNLQVFPPKRNRVKV